MFSSRFRTLVIIVAALLLAAPAQARRLSKRPHRVARRNAAKLVQIDKKLPRHGYNAPIKGTKVGSTRVAQSRYATAAIFKDGSWGVLGMGGLQIFTPTRGTLTPKSPQAILKGIERDRQAARDGKPPKRLGPPKGVTQRHFSGLTLTRTERTNLDGSTVSNSNVVNGIPNTRHKGKEFNTLSRNHAWKLDRHSSSGTTWTAKQKTTQKRDQLGRFLTSNQRDGAAPRK